ncbi:MAG: 50S ribosomal protein L33 [Planctomycetes bacterium]|nr:50S ribosomal protein L33 [Planctomycetota bacterium]
MRDDVALVCEECGRRNYMTSRDLKKEGKLKIKKFCKWDRAHTLHKEAKKK